MIPENDPDEQQKRLRYNDLVAACVILQNTVDMMRTLQDLCRAEDRAQRRFGLSQSVRHQPRKRFGEYTLDLQKPPEPWLSKTVFREAVREARQQSVPRAS